MLRLLSRSFREQVARSVGKQVRACVRCAAQTAGALRRRLRLDVFVMTMPEKINFTHASHASGNRCGNQASLADWSPCCASEESEGGGKQLRRGPRRDVRLANGVTTTAPPRPATYLHHAHSGSAHVKAATGGLAATG